MPDHLVFSLLRTFRPYIWLGVALAVLGTPLGLASVPAPAQSLSGRIDVPPVGRVVDQADLLAPSTEQALTAQLAAHEDATSNQVAVLTLPSLQGRPIEEVSLQVARTWQLGQEEFDNGVLLLIAREDRAMRIEVGYGLEGALPDVVASRIIRYELRPAFRAGEFDGGVEAGVTAILGAINGTYEPPASPSPSMPWLTGLLLVVMGSLFGGIPSYISLMAGARGGWLLWILTLIFLGPFFLGGTVATLVGLAFLVGGDSAARALFPLFGLPVALVAYLWQSIRLIRHPDLKTARSKASADDSITDTIEVWPFTFRPDFWTSGVTAASGRSMGSAGGFSHSSGGFSSGGFSGGGGSFGGGGASGGW